VGELAFVALGAEALFEEGADHRLGIGALLHLLGLHRLEDRSHLALLGQLLLLLLLALVAILAGMLATRLHLLLHLLDELLLLVALLVLQSEGLVLPMELHMFRSVDHIKLLAAGFPHHEVWEAGRWTAGADPAAFPDSQPTSMTFSFFFCSVFLLGPGGAFFGGIFGRDTGI